MRFIRFSLPLILVLAASCNFPQPQKTAVQTVTVERVGTAAAENQTTKTAIPQTTVEPNSNPTLDWTGKTFTVETKNLIIDYPDFVDPAEARKHADTLQQAYDAYLVIFTFGDEQPFGGQKTTIEWNPQVPESISSHNHITMGLGALNLIASGNLNPPNDTFIHELVHVFESAQLDAGRYYIFNFIIGINEAFAEYLECHPKIFGLWDQGPNSKGYCDLLLHGIGDKGPELTLAYYETHKVDPYTLDWGSHPPGASGEVYFRQMLARVSDNAGWDTWEKYFSVTKNSGGSPAAKEVYNNDSLMKKGPGMSDPLVKNAFSEFVSGLGQAIGQDLRPMFRGWGFEL